MLILPAIDLKNGRCVRLVQGRADQETVYHDDPAQVARRFAEEGAAMLHLVDLDGAFEGRLWGEEHNQPEPPTSTKGWHQALT